jgi:hypothetical protein
MATAREKVRICSDAMIVGVAFWDRPHNVTGRAAELDRAPADPRLRLLHLARPDGERPFSGARPSRRDLSRDSARETLQPGVLQGRS